MSMLSPTPTYIRLLLKIVSLVAFSDAHFFRKEDQGRGYLLTCYMCLTDTDASAQPQNAAEPSDCPREREVIEMSLR